MSWMSSLAQGFASMIPGVGPMLSGAIGAFGQEQAAGESPEEQAKRIAIERKKAYQEQAGQSFRAVSDRRQEPLAQMAQKVPAPMQLPSENPYEKAKRIAAMGRPTQ